MFPCTECGCCCRLVGRIKDFPFKTKQDGSCEKFEDNKCTIYKDRPSICRVDEQIERSGMGKEQGYKATVAICNKLMNMFNIDESKRIKL